MDGFIDVVTDVGPGAVVKGVISGTLRMAIPAMLADKVGSGYFWTYWSLELFCPFLFLYINYLQLWASDFIFRKSQPVNQSQHNQVMDMVEDMAEYMHNKAIMGDMHNKAITDLSLLIMKSSM